VEKIALGTFPTPVEKAAALGIWVKRDDLTGDVYGGNKVRKLEWFFGEAKKRGKKRILTLGAVGSHQVVATAIYGKKHGFEVEAILVGQPASEHARENLRVALAQGLEATVAGAWAAAPFVVAARRTQDAYWIPLGGSSSLGSLGFVDAARELAAQVRAGQVPEPDVIVVALGSGGTAAGLAVGLESSETKTRVLAVAVSHPAPLLTMTAKRLARQTAALVGMTSENGARAARRIEVTGSYVGRGYGHPTRAGQLAIVSAQEAGLVVDPTYTAKALACAIDRAKEKPEEIVLYWHTLSTAPLEPLAGAEEIPPRLEKLFK
jgi:1-aminocyclopropane-1-carboxylate deaminase/D-cysteine desulfhydrase-like pyridoxal-dependent ACC family enzyme